MRGPCRRQSMSRDLTRNTLPASANGTAAVVRGAPGVASLVTCLLLGQAGQAHADTTAQADAAGELKRLSVEELMNVEVTSVAKEPQRLLQAAASIQVITAQDIRRSGATSIPEALRLADNLQVSQINAHDWAISARGFNTNLANKLLVLIDGRAVYTPLYGGVLWDVQDYLLEDVDRIEVISGPGGTLWGTNAVNGVINIVTRAARDTQGLYVSGGGGQQLREQAGVRFGAAPSPDIQLRVYGKYTKYADEVTATGASAADSPHMGRGGFRLDAQPSAPDRLTLQGDLYNGTEADGINGEAGRSGANVLGRWTHAAASGASMSVQVYYDHTYLSQPFAAAPPNPPFFAGFPAASLTDDLNTTDVDFQYHFGWGTRQKLAWGLGYRSTHETDNDVSLVRFTPSALDQALYSGFLQDEIQLASGVYLTVGSKLEHNDYTGYEVEPSGRVQWSLDSRQLLWAAISRAVRTPSRYDHDLLIPSGLINPPPPLQFPATYLQGSADFRSEALVAYEAGYRAELAPGLTGSLSAFYNDYRALRRSTAAACAALAHRLASCGDARCSAALGGHRAHQQRADRRSGHRHGAELLRARLATRLARQRETRGLGRGPEPAARPPHRVRLPLAAARADRAQRLRKDHVGVLRSAVVPALRRRLALLLIACALAGAASPVSEYQLKAVFLFNFAHFVEWPAASLPPQSAPFVIGVLGKDPF